MATVEASTVRTWTPARTNPKWLGELGPVNGLVWSWTVPGGYDQMSCTLVREPTFRTDAMDPGRIVEIVRGASVVWSGQLDEPQPSTSGWNITAHGAGTFGTQWDAIYSTWTNQNDAVNQAIARGLRWTNPGIPSSVWLGQQIDSGSQKISDLLNLFCSRGGLLWYVNQQNTLQVVSIPTVPTRLLVVTSPVPRTLAGDTNVLYLRYQTSPDTATAATYSTTVVTNAASIAKHGRLEDYLDLSSVGQQTAAQAQAVGNNVLARYVAASYAGSFSATPGQLMNPGGQAVDLGCEQPGSVCQLLVTDASYGGEVSPIGKITFPIGSYSYDDTKLTATIAPFQNMNLSLSGLLGAAVLVNAPGTGTAAYQQAQAKAAAAKAKAKAKK
jgi:hypothetical protein